MLMLLTEPALLVLALATLGGYAGWHLGKRLVPTMAVATAAAAMGASFLVYQTSAGALQSFLYGAGASLGEALMTFLPVPLAIAATAVVTSAGIRREESHPSASSPAAAITEGLR